MGGNPVNATDPLGLNPAAIRVAFRFGWEVGDLINPIVQPYIAVGLAKVFGGPYASSQQNNEVNAKDCKMLTKGEIDKMKAGGEDPHDHKPKKNGSNFDLYKTPNGDIYVFRKGGIGAGTPTGMNINNF